MIGLTRWSEPRRRAWLEVTVLSALASLPVIATVARVWGHWRPVGDTAAITLRAGDVFGPHSPLVGMPTTLSDSVGQILHHPGPLEFWVIALGQLVSAHRAVPMLAVVSVNLAAMAAAVTLAGWLGGRSGRLLAATALAACTWSLRGDFLVDPYNPYAAWLPLGTFALALAALLAGRLWALPVAIGFGSYAAQSHVSLLVPVAAATVVGLGLAALRAVSSSGGPRDALRTALGAARHQRRPLLVGGAVAAVCWAPVIVDLLVGRHNLLTLLRATGSDGPVLGLDRAWQVVARAVTTPPWLVPDRSAFEVVAPVGGIQQAVAAAVLVGAAGAVAAQWRRRPISVWLLIVALAGLAGGMVAASRIPGGIFAAYALHNYLWLWPFTALLWAGLTVTAAHSIVLRGGERAESARQVEVAGRLTLASLGAVLVLLGVLSVWQPSVRPSVLAGRHGPATADLGAQLAAALPSGETVVVEVEAELDQASVAMGLVLELERRGIDARVTEDLAGSFGDHRIDDGTAHIRLVVVVGRVGPPDPSREDLVLLAAHAPDRSVAVELATASAAIEGRIRDAGGMVVGVDARRLEPDEAVHLVRTGDLVGLGRLGLVTEPWLPDDEFSRYADAQEGPVLHVHVYRADAQPARG